MKNARASNVVPFPVAEPDEFDVAWNIIPSTMKQRSKGKRFCREAWNKHAGKIGGSARLLAALRAYLKGDRDLPKSGGPALDRWLTNERYDAWISEPSAGTDSASTRILDAPVGFRNRFIELLGEDFVRSWIDRATWRDGQLWHPNQFAVDRLEREFRARGIRVKVGLDGPR